LDQAAATIGLDETDGGVVDTLPGRVGVMKAGGVI
jgi:hypothetical protein